MGCVAATAKKRRKQAVMGYKHLAPRQRPRFPTHTLEAYEKRERAAREKRLLMQVRKRKHR